MLSKFMNRSGKKNIMRKNSGFTLLEVMIAVAVLGISLVITMQLFGGALRSASLSRRYTEAVFLARHKLEELSLDDRLQAGGQAGDFADESAAFSWQAEVSPYTTSSPTLTNEEAKARPQVLQIKLTVSWEEQNITRHVELVTLNTSIKEVEAL